MSRKNENTVLPVHSLRARASRSLFLSVPLPVQPAKREITANNVRGLLSYRDTLVLAGARRILPSCSAVVTGFPLPPIRRTVTRTFPTNISRVRARSSAAMGEEERPRTEYARPTRHVH